MPKIIKNCPICGTEYETYPSIDRKTCSKECRSKYTSITQSGKNNPNYGNKWSDEQRKKLSDYQKSISHIISERVKNDWKDNEIRKNATSKLQSKLGKERVGVKNGFYGKKHTEETKNKIKQTFEKIGRKIPDDKKSDYIVYYEESNWIACMFDIIDDGILMLETNGIFNSRNNSNGVVRDHIIGRRYGFNNKVFPEILRHPCNCQILTNKENVSKAHKHKTGSEIKDISLSLDELFNKIRAFEKPWVEQDRVIKLIEDYEKGKRWERKFQQQEAFHE